MALPQEYWMEHTLQEISYVVGTPLVLDNATSKKNWPRAKCHKKE